MVEMVAITEEVYKTDAGAPMSFGQAAYDNMTQHANQHINPIPRDLIRLDCAELENPMRGVLYASGNWALSRPNGRAVWGLTEAHPSKEVALGEFLLGKRRGWK